MKDMNHQISILFSYSPRIITVSFLIIETRLEESNFGKNGQNLVEHEVKASPPENASPPDQHLVSLQ